MPPNASSASPHVDQDYCKAHLDCAKELQAELESETRAINKRLGVTSKDYSQKRGLFEFETEILWTNAIALGILHAICAYSLLTFPWRTKWYCFAWGKF